MRRTAYLILGVLLITASVYGTHTRVLTMGDNNMILLDDANVSMFPSRLLDYPNIAVAEFGSNDMMDLGVHWKLDKDKPYVLGTYLHNNSATLHSYSPVGPPEGKNKRIDLFYARELGGHKAGFHFGLHHSSDVDDKPTDKSEMAMSIWNFDFGLTPAGDKIDVSAGIEMMTFSNKGTRPDSVQYDAQKPAGNMAFYGQGRMFHKMNSQCTVIPHAKLRFGKFEYEDYGLEYKNNAWGTKLYQTVKNSIFEFDLGVGLEFTPATNVLAVMDFGVLYDAVTEETMTPAIPAIPPDTVTIPAKTVEVKDKTFTLPYFKIGFDADVFHWLDVRFGATSYWQTDTHEEDTATDRKKYPENSTYLGMGFHWNRLHVDAQVKPQLILNGFDFIGGQGTGMNLRVSAVYEM